MPYAVNRARKANRGQAPDQGQEILSLVQQPPTTNDEGRALLSLMNGEGTSPAYGGEGTSVASMSRSQDGSVALTLRGAGDGKKGGWGESKGDGDCVGNGAMAADMLFGDLDMGARCLFRVSGPHQ